MSALRPEILFVHGLWMHGCVFALHRRRLRELGWRSHAYSYPSLRGALEGAADGLAAFIAGLDGRPLHVIAHSMGGCVVLDMLARHRPQGLGRIVLLGSPVLGSSSAQQILRVPVLRHWLGRVLPQWLARPMPEAAPVTAATRPCRGVCMGMSGRGGMAAQAATAWPWRRITMYRWNWSSVSTCSKGLPGSSTASTHRSFPIGPCSTSSLRCCLPDA